MVQSYVAKSHGKAVTRYEFSSLFAEAWYAAMTAKNIQAGFKISGVFPFNKHTFDLPTEKYRSFNSLCDVSFENRRLLTLDMKKCMMPVKRTSHLSKYLNTPTPPKVSIAWPNPLEEF